jgi:sulfur-oxidizing protein SoxY
MKSGHCRIALAGLFLALSVLAVRADDPDSAAARESRWLDLEKALFDGKTAAPDSLVVLEAPTRAEDAALVPMTITLKEPEKVKALYLVIDDNPSPVAAHFVFGPAADPRVVKMRVRVNSYTNVHAVAVLQDGSMVEDAKFVKASGGCSAPMSGTDKEAMEGMGEIRLKFASGATPGVSSNVKLMVRHPNFNGMQMNQVTQLYTPARYIDKIVVKAGERLVFDLTTGISLATDPVLSFGMVPPSAGQATVEVHDSENGVWSQAFSVTGETN